MSNLSPDVEVMAEEAGYKRGYFECQSELKDKIYAILREALYVKGSSAWDISVAIGKVFDGK